MDEGCIDRDVEKYKDNKRILAFPRVDREELLQFYTAADLFVNPTLADNFPTVNLECQACGTPVVAFDSDGTKETVAPNAGMVVPRKDYEALRDAILNFLLLMQGQKAGFSLCSLTKRMLCQSISSYINLNSYGCFFYHTMLQCS